MFDRFITIATAAAVTLQASVGIVFFGALTMMILMGFSVIHAPY
jgi:hypothetical protein